MKVHKDASGRPAGAAAQAVLSAEQDRGRLKSMPGGSGRILRPGTAEAADLEASAELVIQCELTGELQLIWT